MARPASATQTWRSRLPWARRPFLALGLLCVLGILGTDQAPGLASALLPCMLVLATCLLLRWPRHWQAWLLPLALLACQRHLHQLQLTRLHPLHESLQSDGPAAVELIADLQCWSRGGKLDPQRALACVRQLNWPARRPGPAASGVWLAVTLPGPMPLQRPGVYRLQGQLSLPEVARNPGAWDEAKGALREGWIAQLHAARVEWQGPAGTLAEARFALEHQAERARQGLRRSLAAGLDDWPEAKAVLLAMALGNSSEAGPQVQWAFRQSGTLHVFAVSGLHVALLASFGAMLCHALGLGRWRMLPLLPLVLGYAWLTGWRSSAARAALMISLVLLAPLGMRRCDLQNSLGFAASLLLLSDPQSLFQPGFQLSFAVLWAIALWAPPLMRTLRQWHEPDPLRPTVLLTPMQRLGLAGLRQLCQLACTSLAAWLGSLPLLWGHYRNVTPIGLAANMLLVPLSSLSMALICVSLLASVLGPQALQTCNLLNARLASLMVKAADAFARMPGGNFTLDLRLPAQRPLAQIDWLSLPQGGSAALLRDSGRNWMLDCGSQSDWNRQCSAFLNHQGVNQLHGLILTHTDAHHSGAATQALRWGQPVIHSSILEPNGPRTTRARQFNTITRDSLRQLAHEVAPESPGWLRHFAEQWIAMSAEARLEVLHPYRLDQASLADDRAMVFRLHVRGLRILWMGDAGFETECLLLERHRDLQCDVLFCGLHQSDPGGLPELLQACRPQVVLFADGQDLSDHAAPEYLPASCQSLRLPLWRLSREGALELTLWPQGWRLRGFCSGRETWLRPKTEPPLKKGSQPPQSQNVELQNRPRLPR